MWDALGWWFSLEVLGAITFPVAFAFFGGLKDRGYTLAKFVGLVLVGYTLWLSATLGLLPNSRGSVIFLLLLFAIVGLGMAGRYRQELQTYIRENWRFLLLVEILFAVSFFGAVWVRSFINVIGHTEQPMDVALLSSLVRDSSIPPNDPWLSGNEMNYYYFGYFIAAMQTELTGVGSIIGYNLALALVMALAAVAAFGIVYNLAASGSWDAVARPVRGWLKYGAVAAGLLGVVTLLIFSNYLGVAELAAVHGLDWHALYKWVDVGGLDGPRESSAWYPTENWWWFRSARIFPAGTPDVITEFPFFSFLLGDLHPHFMAIPFLLLTVAIAWNIFAVNDDGASAWRRPAGFLLMLILVGGVGFVHTVNLPVALVLLVVVFALRQFRKPGRVGRGALVSVALFGGLLSLGSLLVYLPFYWSYETPASGILTTGGPATKPFHLFIQWGLFLLLITALAVYAISRHRQGWRFSLGQVAAAAGVALAPLLAWALLHPIIGSGGSSAAAGSGAGWLTLAWLTATLALLVLAVVRNVSPAPEDEGDTAILFGLAIAALALLVLVGSELFFIKDVFVGNLPRLNTVFKGWYVAWLLLALGSAFAGYSLLRDWRPRGPLSRIPYGVFVGSAVLLLLGGLVYPVTGTLARTEGLSTPSTLDGLAFLKSFRPGEYEAIQWLRGNIEGTPVLMEAPGDSFTEFSRRSAYTGLPTVLGWAGHENQWRGSFAPQGTRREDIDTAYNTTDIQEAIAILDKYDVEIVYVGYLEREKYDPAGLEKFRRFMRVAFENDEATIYERHAAQSLVTTP
ncbi:MAG: DUF2298 domain-containing protein [Dehalococcoidia bacterium]|nr:DUF2298 domain-containing protein [Dehalococcoidia bacterium]